MKKKTKKERPTGKAIFGKPIYGTYLLKDAPQRKPVIVVKKAK